MPNMFHAQFDLELLADKLAPLIADRLNGDSRSERKPANEPDNWPADQPAEEDPWGSDEPAQENRSQGRSERSTGSSNRQGGNRSGGGQRSSGNRSGGSRGGSRGNSDIPEHGQEQDSNGKLWEFGLSDAPECDCGLVAAEVTKPRAKWRAWACPKGFSKNTYRDKCDMFDFQ